MRCEEVRTHYVEHLAGTLDATDVEALETHLASCAECREEHSGFEEVWNAMGRLPAGPVPSRRLRERLSAMVAAERASGQSRPASREMDGPVVSSPPWPVRTRLAQLAVAASLLLVGAIAGRASVRAPLPADAGKTAHADAELADVRGELRTMRQMLTLSLMQQQSATERLRGVSWTAQIDQPGNDIVAALLDTLLHDPNVNVRLAAVDALRRVSERTDVRAGITRAVADKSAPLLQVAVIDYLVETRDPQAPALLRQLTQDTSLDAAVRGRAEWALTRLS
ncbi:MAG: HEAT repeat domain-containing protein [Vicinamibacterales bacterium]